MMPATIEIVEVGPRDGLQDEPGVVSTEDKIAYVQGIVRAGIARVEVASFANPKRVPQMADAEAVIAGLAGTELRPIGLVLTERGLDRALATGIGEINAVVVVTDTFSRENQGMSTADATAIRGGATALDASTGGLGGCPFAPGATGNIATEDLVHMLEHMGVSTGVQVDALLETVAFVERIVGHPVPGMLSKAGVFPRRMPL